MTAADALDMRVFVRELARELAHAEEIERAAREQIFERLQRLETELREREL